MTSFEEAHLERIIRGYLRRGYQLEDIVLIEGTSFGDYICGKSLDIGGEGYSVVVRKR